MAPISGKYCTCIFHDIRSENINKVGPNHTVLSANQWKIVFDHNSYTDVCIVKIIKHTLYIFPLYDNSITIMLMLQLLRLAMT